jgi:hypothetical protein
MFAMIGPPSTSLNRSRLAFIAGLGMMVFIASAAVLSAPPPLDIGPPRSGEKVGEMRPFNPGLLGKETREIAREGRRNPFAFPQPIVFTPLLPFNQTPIDETPISPRPMPPPPPDEPGVVIQPVNDPVIIKGRDLPVLFYGVSNGVVHFADKKKPDKIMDFRVGEIIPDHNFTIFRATPQSAVLLTPQGEYVEIVIFMDQRVIRPPDGGKDQPMDKGGDTGKPGDPAVPGPKK